MVKTVVMAIAVVVLLAATAGVVFVVTFDANRYCPLVIAKLEDALRRPVSLERISLGWQGGLALRLQELTVYADERKFYHLDVMIEKDFSSRLQSGRPYSSREVMHEFGKWVSEMDKDKDGICVAAYEMGVPVFVPALCDSGFGFSLMFANRRRKRRLIVDHMHDVDESSKITEKSSHTAVVIVGGGVPKNFIQQTAVIASYQTRHDRTHDFAVQFTTDVPQWGGLSGSTFEEAQSWGKYNAHARMVQCFADATISLPIVAQALSQRFKRFRRRVPVFQWGGQNGSLKIKYQPVRL